MTPGATHRQGLFKHSLLLLIAAQLGNVANLLFQMFMARELTPDEYSVLIAMLGMIMILGTPTQALIAAMAHFSARFLQEGRAGDIRRLLRFWTGRTMLAMAPLGILGILFSGGIARFYNVDTTGAVWAMIVIFVLTPFLPLLMGVLQGIQSFLWLSLLGAAIGWGRLLLALLLVVWVLPSALSALGAHAVALLATILLAAEMVRRKLGASVATEQSLPASQDYFLKSCVILTSYGILATLDMTLIRRFLPEAAGQASYAFQLSRIAVFLPVPIAMALFPKVTSHAGITREDRRNLAFAILYACVIIGGAAGGCLLFPRLALSILGVEQQQIDAELIRLLRVTVLAMCPLGLGYLLMNFELAQHRFSLLPGSLLLAVAYVGGVVWWHGSVNQVVAVLAVCSTLFLLLTLFALPRKTPERMA